MNTLPFKLAFLFNFFFVFCFSQADTSSNKSLPGKPERYFRFNYDNDFFSATDRYYSQGIYLELIIPAIKKSPLSKVLIPLNKNTINYYGITLEQDVFTPSSIRHVGIFYGDRPYTAVFFLAHTLTSINTDKKLRLTTKLDIGILGPNALGEQEQKGIHKALVNIQPLGWEYQLAQDIVLNYDIQYEKGLINKKNIDLITTTGLRAGTLYDDVSSGMIIRMGWKQNYFEHLFLPKDFSNKETGKFQCYLFVKGILKGIGYNATLQGGLFNRDNVYIIPSEDITRVKGEADIGLVLAYKRFSLEYTKVYISPEFRNGLSHGWGHCAITFSF